MRVLFAQLRRRLLHVHVLAASIGVLLATAPAGVSLAEELESDEPSAATESSGSGLTDSSLDDSGLEESESRLAESAPAESAPRAKPETDADDSRAVEESAATTTEATAVSDFEAGRSVDRGAEVATTTADSDVVETASTGTDVSGASDATGTFDGSDSEVASTATSTSAAAQAAQAGILGPPSGLQIVISSSVQAGLQIDDSTHHAQASLGISLNYKLHEKIFLAGQLSPYVDLTPMPNNNRRTDFSPNGNSIRLNFRNLFHEKFTDIRLGGSFGYALPISYNDWFTGNPRLGSLSGAVQLFRGVGPVMLVGSVGAQAPLFLNQRASIRCDPEKVKEVGASCPSYQHGNSYNTAFSLSSSLLAIYNVGSFSFSSSLQLGTSWSHGPGSANEPNNTNDHANRRFSQGFSLQGAYAVNKNWSVNAGFFNSGPQITGEWGRRNPFFNKDFAAVFIGVDWVR